MATDVERLVVQLEASITKYERSMQKALGQTNQTAKRIEDRFAKTEARIGQSFTNAGALIGKAFAGVAALRGAQVLIDASTRVENSLKVAGLAGAELTKVYDRLFASSQRNAAPLEALTELYGRASLVQKELGVSTEELLGFTDNIAVALRVSGKSASESSGALLQLSQALGSGIVRAEEFNSILEGALPIAQAAAAGLTEAGGSVAKLRQLVVDGKVSSEAFFRAFEAGSVILTEKVANAEMTVSQGFIRLQNILIDAAGKFDTATGASDELGRNLSEIANLIALVGNAFADNQGAIDQFIDVIDGTWSREAGESIRRNIIDTIKDIRMGPLVDETTNMQIALDDALLSLGDWRAGWSEELPPQLFASVDGLIEKLIAGGDEAKVARAALEGLGAVNPGFEQAFTALGNLAGELQRVRGEAVATAAAVVGANAPPQSFAGQDGMGPVTLAPTPVSLKDYKLPASSKGKGGGSSSRQSAGEKFDDVLKKQAEENRLLAEKTALQATLNPLVEDYGFAVERLNVEQELLSAATKAGIAMTPALKAQIDQLATGYANASVEAKKLAESQEQMKQIAGDFGEAGSSAIKGFISDLREGKSGADALANALNAVLDKVIDISLNMILGGGGGGGIFGGIAKLFGFADGGIAKNGKPLQTFARGGVSKTAAIFGEAGAEAAVPLPDGRRIPVDLRMPQMPAAGGGAQAVHVTVGVSADSAGNLTPFVESVSQRTVARSAPGLVSASVAQANKSAPAAMAKYQQQQQGSDYRG